MDNEKTQNQIEDLTTRMKVSLKSICQSMGLDFTEELFNEYVILFNLTQLRHQMMSEEIHQTFTNALMETVENNPEYFDKLPK